jgi:hypothetical protein
MSFHVPEKYRITNGIMGSDETYGNNGAFKISIKKLKIDLFCVASDQLGWDHVSVSTSTRCPTWEEMSFIKNLFWDDEDCVIQYHPPKSQYVNNHPYCLHLWRPTYQGATIMQPHRSLVGV